MTIDLRSDTVTRPTPGMMQAMFLAKVGDDVFEEDPTIKALEEKTAALFSMEAGIFCPSGTMTNQIAVNVHTRPGDEVILHKLSHLYYYEGGGMMHNSGVSVCLLEGERGLIAAQDVEDHINPADDIHRPLTRMVAVENTMNKGGGSVYNFGELKKIGEVARKHKLAYHMDGARIFNALVATGQKASDYGKLFDSISVCFSKGLGAPVGSVLLGSKAFIYKARRVRKLFGGGMRQAGYLAAAGIYALDHHVNRLSEDHRKAKALGEALSSVNWVEKVLPIDTNILIFRTHPGMPATTVVKKLGSLNLLCMDFDKQSIRMVTHLDFTDQMLEEAIHIIKSVDIK